MTDEDMNSDYFKELIHEKIVDISCNLSRMGTALQKVDPIVNGYDFYKPEMVVTTLIIFDQILALFTEDFLKADIREKGDEA